jgi:hypothetical protein
MKLHAEASPYDVRLRSGVTLSNERRSWRRREGVEVPLKPRAFFHKRMVMGSHGDPSDLRHRRTGDTAAEGARQELRSEANSQHWHGRSDRLAQEFLLLADERK